MWLNSSTDVSNISDFIVFARHSIKNEIHKQLLFGESLRENCTRQDTSTMALFFLQKPFS